MPRPSLRFTRCTLVFAMLATASACARQDGAEVGNASTTMQNAGRPVAAATTAMTPASERVSRIGRFGAVTIYRPQGEPKQAVLFFSGDGGWNQGVVSMARHLRDRGALVAGIDIRTYFSALDRSSDACAYTIQDFDRLSRMVQQAAGVRDYRMPILVGYSSGATLVYAALNQSPDGIFAGGLSLGFCPDLELAKPLCKGQQLAATRRRHGVGYDLAQAKRLGTPWIALQGDQDQVCDADATQRFVGGIGNARVVMLPKVGHGYGVEAHWLPQFLAAYDALGGSSQADSGVAPGGLADLPLLEMPARARQGDSFVLLLTGDGGYAGLDQDLTAAFAATGRPVVVLNSLKYFWTKRTPDGLAADIDRIVRAYARRWNKPRVLLAGYSQGADVLPFALNRLSPDVRARVTTAALIGLSDNALFEFHFTNWLTDPKGVPTLPELRALRGLRVTCIYGAEETDSACAQVPSGSMRVVKLPGGHHFNGDYEAVTQAVLAGAAG